MRGLSAMPAAMSKGFATWLAPTLARPARSGSCHDAITSAPSQIPVGSLVRFARPFRKGAEGIAGRRRLVDHHCGPDDAIAQRVARLEIEPFAYLAGYRCATSGRNFGKPR